MLSVHQVLIRFRYQPICSSMLLTLVFSASTGPGIKKKEVNSDWWFQTEVDCDWLLKTEVEVLTHT